MSGIGVCGLFGAARISHQFTRLLSSGTQFAFTSEENGPPSCTWREGQAPTAGGYVVDDRTPGRSGGGMAGRAAVTRIGTAAHVFRGGKIDKQTVLALGDRYGRRHLKHRGVA